MKEYLVRRKVTIIYQHKITANTAKDAELFATDKGDFYADSDFSSSTEYKAKLVKGETA